MSSQFNTTTFSTSRNLVSSRDPYRAVNEPKNKEQADKSEKATLVICAHCHQLLNSCFRSQIDHSKEISLDIWSVSILIDNKPGRLNRLLNHHAYLIIEGFSIEGKFWQKAHLMGPGTFGDVRVIRDCYSGFSNNGVIQLTSKKYGYFDLSECRLNRQTWVVSKEKIEKMLLQIQWEQNHPEATPFRFLGEKSFVSMKREFVDTRHPQLIEMENRDKKGFKELCYLFRQKLVLENIKKQTFGYFKSMNISVKFSYLPFCSSLCSLETFLVRGLFNQNWSLSFMRIDNKLLIVCLFVYAISGLVVAVGASLHRRKITMLEKKVNEKAGQISFVEDRAKIDVAISQNCFNWARKQLLIIDIVVPENHLEWLIAIPEFSLPTNGAVIDCLTDKKS